jgi:RNA polymerase sigma-70 factor (ECF subfamily)
MSSVGPLPVEMIATRIDTGARIAARSVFVPHTARTRVQDQVESGADLRRPTWKAGEKAGAGANGAVPDAVAANALLAARLCRKEPAALEELYDRTCGRAFGLAYRILNDGAAAEDIVQDVFLWVWDNTHRIDPARGNVESLLMTLIHRRSIDALRARARRDALPVEAGFDVIDEAASDLLAALTETVTREVVAKAMDDLNKDQRHVIEMAYFEGLTQREISERTGLPIGTVKSRMRLGMDRLRTAFGLGGER